MPCSNIYRNACDLLLCQLVSLHKCYLLLFNVHKQMVWWKDSIRQSRVCSSSSSTARKRAGKTTLICVYAYNSAKHESSKFSLFEMMFGRKAMLPVDLDGARACKDELMEGFKPPSRNSPFLRRIHGERTAPLQKAHATGVYEVTTMFEVVV